MSKRSAEACHERMQQLGVRALADAELLTILLGPTVGMRSTREAAQRLLDARPLAQIAWGPGLRGPRSASPLRCAIRCAARSQHAPRAEAGP